MNDSQVSICKSVEEQFGNSNPPTTVEQIDQLLKQGVFHSTHHFVWVSMLHIGESMAGNPMRCRDGKIRRKEEKIVHCFISHLFAQYLIYHPHPPPSHPTPVGTARQMWERVLTCAKEVLPTIHPELVVLEDKLGQILVSGGNIKEASVAFKRAFDMSCILTGNVPSKGNLLLKKLYESTPIDVNQLKFFYDDNCQTYIEDLKIEGKIEAARAFEQLRDRAVSSTGMEMDDENDEKGGNDDYSNGMKMEEDNEDDEMNGMSDDDL
jgi:hypothetical protein